MPNKNILELVMIVKNSGDILRECLRINSKYIDRWTIVDTGSTDNTKEIIKEELQHVPGNLFDIKFEDFSQARNKSLELSSKSCKYTIILDDSYAINGGELLRSKLEKSKSNAFTIRIGHLSNEKLLNDYYSIRIFKSSLNYRYKFRVHEFLQIKKKDICEINDESIFIDDVETVEHKNRSVVRFKKDVEFLLLDLKENPTEPRTIYYLAKTYHQLNKLDESLSYFKKLKNLRNIDSEYYFMSEYESSCINFQKNNDIQAFKNQLLNVQSKFPNRIEPGYKLAIIMRDSGDIEEAERIIDYIAKLPKPSNSFTLLEEDIYEYFIPYLYIEIKLQLGKVFEVVNLLKYLLSIYSNNQPLLNMKYSITDDMNVSSIKLSDNKTIAIHTGGQQMIFKHWNPRGDKRISGSEYMAINLGKEFLKMGYKVIIIGSFEDKDSSVDHQGIVDNIQYIDYKYFSDFALRYVIDYLFVSRFTSNLLYYDNIKNVYLWVHDVLPIMDASKCFQIHKTKFKGVIAVSNWQKNNIVNKLNTPEDRIIVSRNAIYPERFLNKNIEKKPYRFIYTSDPSRGLSNLIDVLPRIKERYPLTTLYIFAISENIDDNTMNKIKELDYVFLNTRLSQDEIANEFLKSDIWFYPTDFKETYCITAVEAMCSKCLVCTINLGALKEIVMGKGILCDYPINNNKMLNKIFFVLEKPYLKEMFIEKAYNWAIEQTFDKLANDWKTNLLTTH